MDTTKQSETFYVGESLACAGSPISNRDVSHKSNKDYFCRFIDDIQWAQGDSIFQQMNDICPESVAKSFRIKVGNATSNQDIDHTSVDTAMLRVVACSLFGDVNSAWAYYQTHANEKQAETAFRESSLPPPLYLDAEAPKPKTQQKAEIIPDISTDPRFFTSSDLPSPANLVNIIPAQFLRIVEKYGWKEALPLIYSSRQGCHAVLYDEIEGCEYPDLKSSNMIVEPHKGPNSASLVFNDDFRGKNWESMSSTDHIIKVITDYVGQLNFELQEPIDFDALNNLPQNPTDNGEFEDLLFEALGLKNCVEQIRLTTAEPNSFKHSYNGVTRYSELFTSLLRKPFSLTVSYEDLCGGLEGLNRIYDDRPCYLPLSRCQMKPDELSTQKYILLNQNVCQNMENTDWRIVGLMAQKLMKGKSIDQLVEKQKKKLRIDK